MKEVKLSNTQLGMLTVGILYGSSVIENPAIGAKRDAWAALILAWIVGTGFILAVLYISKLNNGKNFSEILYSCFGKTLGRLIAVLYLLYFLYKTVINLGIFGMFMATVSYPETPLIIIMGVFLTAVVYLVRCGLTTVGRISEILVPFIPLPVIIVSVSVITMKNYTGFQPMFLEIAPIIKSAANVLSTIVGDFIVFLMVIPYTNSEKGRFKAVFMGYAALGILLMIIVCRNLIIIGPELSDNIVYPSHVAAQLIPLVSIDPLVDINLLLGGGFKVAIFLYALSKLTAELFNLSSYKSLVCAYGTLNIVLASWVIPNGIELKRWVLSWSILFITYPFQIIIPMAMLLISVLKRPRKA